MDIRLPLGVLIEESFESDHAARIEGTLLMLASATLFEFDEEAATACWERADELRAHLSERTRAALEISRGLVQDFADGRAMLAALEEAGENDTDHPELWNFIVAMAFLGMNAGDVTTAEFLRYAKRAVASDPTDAVARYNLGEALLAAGEPARALVEFDDLVSDPEYSKRPYLHLNRGIVHYNAGRFQKALDAYQEALALQQRSSVNHLYVADTYRQLGLVDEARRHYLRALHLQPDLVDAHRGYWFILKDEAAPHNPAPWFDRAFLAVDQLRRFPVLRALRRPLLRRLLVRHYRRHPEDSRIHYMLGARALLDGRLEMAEERLTFANELLDGHDLEAQARLAIVYAMQGRAQDAKQVIDALWWNAPPPGLSKQDFRRALAASFFSPFLDEPEIGARPGVDWVFGQFFEIFKPVIGDMTEFLNAIATKDVLPLGEMPLPSTPAGSDY